ncbi:hypothetical protein IW261DRAFT_119687 [Armillaria novae-zelandiae]|uniref:Uncharacterized protein n=1 Tax=Armillaria novae-zelandiae TaxID=153914 RepID=A0AA39P9P4_9AGAR|nr:hypothetical protein IW261DRAFT_119687 [Armillaria novae-zelandiae]
MCCISALSECKCSDECYSESVNRGIGCCPKPSQPISKLRSKTEMKNGCFSVLMVVASIVNKSMGYWDFINPYAASVWTRQALTVRASSFYLTFGMTCLASPSGILCGMLNAPVGVPVPALKYQLPCDSSVQHFDGGTPVQGPCS